MSEDEFVSFIKENQKQFYIMAYQYVRNEQMALDVVQEAIFRAFKSYKKIKEPQYMKSWFCRIVINASLDMCKRENVLIYNDELLEQVATEQGREEYENLDLYEAVNRLDVEGKTIITLRYFEDMKIEDIAKIMELNSNTVKSKLYRTLRILKKNLTGGEGYEI